MIPIIHQSDGQMGNSPQYNAFTGFDDQDEGIFDMEGFITPGRSLPRHNTMRFSPDVNRPENPLARTLSSHGYGYNGESPIRGPTPTLRDSYSSTPSSLCAQFSDMAPLYSNGPPNMFKPNYKMDDNMRMDTFKINDTQNNSFHAAMVRDFGRDYGLRGGSQPGSLRSNDGHVGHQTYQYTRSRSPSPARGDRMPNMNTSMNVDTSVNMTDQAPQDQLSWMHKKMSKTNVPSPKHLVKQNPFHAKESTPTVERPTSALPFANTTTTPNRPQPKPGYHRPASNLFQTPVVKTNTFNMAPPQVATHTSPIQFGNKSSFSSQLRQGQISMQQSTPERKVQSHNTRMFVGDD